MRFHSHDSLKLFDAVARHMSFTADGLPGRLPRPGRSAKLLKKCTRSGKRSRMGSDRAVAA
jgi:hypothetical protein